MKLKIVTGFRKDQEFSVDAEEAHKAYYLFFNPDARTTFSDGLAIKGSDIDRIEPDYQGTMGWNPTHTLDDNDMNEIRDKGIDKKIRAIMSVASQIAKLGNESDLNITLSEAVKKYPQIQNKDNHRLAEGMKKIGAMLKP